MIEATTDRCDVYKTAFTDCCCMRTKNLNNVIVKGRGYNVGITNLPKN